MNALNDLDHDAILNWLRSALMGNEALEKTSADEPNHLSILRAEQTLLPEIRRSIRLSSMHLLREFCAIRNCDENYSRELLFLVGALKDYEATSVLENFALTFEEEPKVRTSIRQLVLGVLVDSPMPLSIDFWKKMLREDSLNQAGMAFSGLLGIDIYKAIEMLPLMPDDDEVGQFSALNLDLARDSLEPEERSKFIGAVRAILPRCRMYFSAPIREWLKSIVPTDISADTLRSRLEEALLESLGPDEAAPRILTTKLYQPLNDVGVNYA